MNNESDKLNVLRIINNKPKITQREMAKSLGLSLGKLNYVLQSLKKSYKDALNRAKAYIKAGADGIMIHSKQKNPNDLIKFCKFYNKFKNRKPLIIVPSSFSHMTEKKVSDLGANIIIYANHLLRSAYPNMLKTAQSILKYSRAKEAEKSMLSIKEILNLIPGTK